MLIATVSTIFIVVVILLIWAGMELFYYGLGFFGAIVFAFDIWLVIYAFLQVMDGALERL